MTAWLKPTHIRTRLTLWYVAVLGAILLLSWGLTGAFLFFQLRAQLDHYVVQDIETVEGLLFFDAAGHLTLREDYHNHPESKQVLERLIEVRSTQGAVLYRNARLGNQPLGGGLTPMEGEGGYSIRSARLANGTRLRLASRRHTFENQTLQNRTLENQTIVVRLAYSEEDIWSRFEELMGATAIALPFVILLIGFGGFLLTRRALAPLQQMAERAEQITSDRLHERLPNSATDDELGQLARIFNNLLARLEQSFEQLRRFTSDASHELRTPLASIRSVGEVALQTDGSRDQYRDSIGSMLEEVNRLTALVDSLLTISRADGGEIKLHPTEFSAMDLAREATGLFEVLVDEKGQQITIEGDDRVVVMGDRLFLRQALVNIIHNAVKFSPAGGRIAVNVQRWPAGGVCFEVSDTGPGIQPEQAQRIFDRFYRTDDARSVDGTGAGLGLSIARWAVRVNGGEVALVNASAAGSTFQILLPGTM